MKARPAVRAASSACATSRARGHRANLSLFVWIGVGGVFLGVAALIVVLAVMTGFQDGIRDKIISANPHLLVVPDAAAAASPTPAAWPRACAPVPGVRVGHAVRPAAGAVHERRAATRTAASCAAWTSATPSVRAAIARADPRRAASTPLAEGGAGASCSASELARTLGVRARRRRHGDLAQGAMTAVGMVPKMRRFTVAGTVEVGMYEYDSSLAYTSLAAAQEFAGLGDRRDRRRGQARRSVRRQGGRARAIDRPLGWPYWVRDWMDMNRNLFAALQLEKLALFVIVTIIVLVAAFAIIGHLVLLVAEKRKEIGILKAIGATAGSITRRLLRGRHD